MNTNRMKIVWRLKAVIIITIIWCFLMPLFSYAEDSDNNTSVYSTVNGIEFFDSEGTAVEPEVTSSGSYTVYSFNDMSEAISYSKEGYGTGVIYSLLGKDIYLRPADYTLAAKAQSQFTVTVTNTEDESLVYRSDSDDTSVKLLIPALGYGTRYRYHFEPEDDEYASFSGNLWMVKGTSVFEGFKSAPFNLSDSATYRMGKKKLVTFKIPEGADLKVKQLVKFYRQRNEFDTVKTGTEDGFDIYESYVSDDGATLQYEVTKEGCVKKVGSFSAGAGTVTISDLIEDPQQTNSQYENSLITNINAAKFLELETGESKDLWFSRAWQASDGVTTNKYVDPDNHFYILEGDSCVVDEYGIVTATKPGVSVIAMTYDAMQVDNAVYGAVDPEKIAVFVVSVNGDSSGIDTGINISDFNTFYIASKITTEGNSEVDTNDSYPYTFTPTAANSGDIDVSVATVCGYPQPIMSEWKRYGRNDNGSYTVDLKNGKNIVRIRSGSAEKYYVLNASETEVNVENMTAPGQSITAGDTVKVSYTNVITPQPKLAAIYNPGYPSTVYLWGTGASDGDTVEDFPVEGPHTQYGIRQNANVEFVAPNTEQITISNLRIHSGAFGSAPTQHYSLGLQSEGTSAADSSGNSPETTDSYSYFTEIPIKINTHECEYVLEAMDRKYLIPGTKDSHEAVFYKSCKCGAKGRDSFSVNRIFAATGSKTPASVTGLALERFAVIGADGKLGEGHTETSYTIVMPPETDKTKPLMVEMSPLLRESVYSDPNKLKELFCWVATTNKQIKSMGSLYDYDNTGRSPGYVSFVPEWSSAGIANIYIGLGDSSSLNMFNSSIKFYSIKLIIEDEHNYSDDWSYDDEKHWKECDCGDRAEIAEHNFSWVIDKEATEAGAGFKHEECEVCHAVRSEGTVIPARSNDSTDISDNEKVYFTLSERNDFVKGVDGTPIARVECDLEYFDLADYGLEDYYRYESKSYEDGGDYIEGSDVVEQTTLLHVFIRALEKYYLGRKLTANDFGTDTITLSGNATHLYLKNFWGHNCDLMYFINHAFPYQREGYGATCDYILLNQGDEIDVVLFPVNGHLNGAFYDFSQSAASVKTGDTLDLTLYGSPTSGVGEMGSKIPMAKETIRISDDKGKTWETYSKKTDLNGKVALQFDSPGEYYVSAGPDFANYENVAPPLCVITVSEEESDSHGGDNEARQEPDDEQGTDSEDSSSTDYDSAGGKDNDNAQDGSSDSETETDNQESNSGGEKENGQSNQNGSQLTEESSASEQSNNGEDAAEKERVRSKSVVINSPVITRKIVKKALKKANNLNAVKVTIGKKVKKIKKGAFKGTKVKILIVKTKKLKKATVKKAFQSSKVKTINVKAGSKKVNRKLVKKYKAIFTKKNCGKKVKVK